MLRWKSVTSLPMEAHPGARVGGALSYSADLIGELFGLRGYIGEALDKHRADQVHEVLERRVGDLVDQLLDRLAHAAGGVGR